MAPQTKKQTAIVLLAVGVAASIASALYSLFNSGFELLLLAGASIFPIQIGSYFAYNQGEESEAKTLIKYYRLSMLIFLVFGGFTLFRFFAYMSAQLT